MKKLTGFLCAMVLVFGVVGKANAALMDGLVAYYPFTGSSTDESGNGNDAIVHGATLTDDRFGNPNSAYELSGNYGPYGGGNYIELPDMVEGLQSLSISMWVNECEIGYEHGEGYIMFGITHLDRVSIYHNRGSDLGELGRIDFTISNAVEREVSLSVDFNEAWQGEYQHYAMTYDGEHGLFQAYMNGILIGEQITSALPITTTGDSYAGLGIHWWNDGSGESTRFNGIFDDISIYDRALSESEIQELYSLPNPVPIPSAVWLLGSAFIGLVGFRRKLSKD